MKSVGTRFSLLRTGLALGISLAVPAFMGVGCECDPPLDCAAGQVEVDGECVDDPGSEGEGEGEQPDPVPALSIDPTVANFGSVVVGDQSAAQDFTITNSGDAGSDTGTISVSLGGSNDFQILSNDCTSLAQGATCTVSVAFTPTAEGPRSANLTASAGDASASAALSGDGQGDPELTINPSTANFGNAVVGTTTGAQTFTITNNGDGDSGDLTVTLGGADGTHFAIEADACAGTSLASGASCDIDVSFSPTSAGAKNATLTVDGAAADPVTAALSGTGQDDAQLTIAPAARDFGTVTAGASSTELDFTVTNVGDVDTGVLSETVAGADAAQFAVTGSGCDGQVLAPNASCVVSITFQASGAAGARSATLTVDGAPGGSVDADLTGTVVDVGDLTIDPTANDFGDQTVNTTSASATFTIENTGGSATGTLSAVLGGTDAGDFPIVAGGNGCQGVVLPAGGTCTVAVTFRPSTGGGKTANLTVTDSASGDLAVAALSGNGLDPAQLTVDPTGIDFGSVATGAQSGNSTITVRNVGSVNSGTPTVTLGGANFSQFTLVANGCTAALAPNGTCTVTVRYNPTAEAAHNATITVSANPGGTAVTQLTGTGISPSQLVFSNNGGAADMGTVIVGGTGTARVITITNNGDETSGVIATTLIGAGAAHFTLVENCNTLTSGSSCTATVTFTPVAPGAAPPGLARVAQLQVSATPGAVTPITTGDLTGRAVDKLSADPTSFNFNNVRIGSFAQVDIDFTQNTGVGEVASGVLTVTSNSAEFIVAPTTLTDPDVAGTGDDCAGANLDPDNDNQCQVRIVFNPTGAPGLRTATLTVTNAATGSTATVALSGNAQGALAIGADQAVRDGILDFVDDAGSATDAVELDDATLDFGRQPINTTSGLQRFIVINTANSDTQRLSTDLTGGANFIIQTDTCAGAVLQEQTLGAIPGANAQDDCDVDVGGAACLDTCVIQGWFLPRTTGAKTGTITITGNVGQVITGTFTGTGITAAQVVANPATIDFQSIRAQANSAVVPVTVTNAGEQATTALDAPTITGADDGEFDIVTAGSTCIDPDGAGPLTTPPVLCNGGAAAGCPAGSLTSCIVNVQFTPGANSQLGDATKEAVLTVSATTGGSDTTALAGTVLNQLTVTGNGAFGNDVIDGTPTTALTFTIQNLGAQATTALTADIDDPELGDVDGDFAIVTSGATDCNGVALAANATCTVSVVFDATDDGLREASVRVRGVGGDVEISSRLSGTGQDPASLEIIDDTFDFGSVLIGSVSGERSFTVRNIGDVTTSAITTTSNNTADFDIVSNNCTTLAANATCTVVTRFSPANGGARTAEITFDITNVGASVDEDIDLSGDGLAAESVTVTPSFRDFGNAVEGTPGAPLAFTITNTDNDVSGTLSAAVTGEFELVDDATNNSNCVGATLNAGATCTQFVRFAPVIGGGFGFTQGTLTITETGGANAANSATAGLSGNAQRRADVTINPTSNDFGSVAVGTASPPVTFTVQNIGDVSTGAVTAPALGGINPNQFQVLNNTCTGGLLLTAQDNAAAGTDQCTFDVVFVPTATNFRNATVTVAVAGSVTTSVSATLAGLGIPPPQLAINPVGDQNLGNVPVTDTNSVVYTLTNDDLVGDETGGISFSISNTTDFAITGGTCVSDDPSTPDVNEGTTLGDPGLNPGSVSSCTIEVTFAPTTPTAETNTLTVVSNPGGTVTGTQSGVGVSQLDLALTTPFIQTPTDDLPDVSDGETEDGEFTVTNNGTVQSGVISVFLTKATEFSIVSNDCSGAPQTLAPGGDFCTLVVRYSPLDGTLNDSATITVEAVPGDSDSVTFQAVSQP